MFFRHQQPRQLSFSDRVSKARDAGFRVESGARTRAFRDGFAADLAEESGGTARIGSAGIAIGGEIGLLVDVGFQKLFQTPKGVQTPARAEHLKGLHAFLEDLREALGLTSLYNEGLGSTNELHLYDRVVGRDKGTGPRPWQR